MIYFFVIQVNIIIFASVKKQIAARLSYRNFPAALIFFK